MLPLALTTTGRLDSLDKALRKLISQDKPLHVVYEAGPCGFVIRRHLTRQGLVCVVVAPSSIARPSGDRIKTDRRDALLLVRLARSGDVSAVRVAASTHATSRSTHFGLPKSVCWSSNFEVIY